MTWQEFSTALQALARKMPTTSPNPLDERLLHVRCAMDLALGQVKAAARYEEFGESVSRHIAARRAS